MKQKLHDKAFMPFVCLVGKRTITELVRTGSVSSVQSVVAYWEIGKDF
jgi:hypothetical protein